MPRQFGRLLEECVIQSIKASVNGQEAWQPKSCFKLNQYHKDPCRAMSRSWQGWQTDFSTCLERKHLLFALLRKRPVKTTIELTSHFADTCSFVARGVLGLNWGSHPSWWSHATGLQTQTEWLEHVSTLWSLANALGRLGWGLLSFQSHRAEWPQLHQSIASWTWQGGAANGSLWNSGSAFSREGQDKLDVGCMLGPVNMCLKHNWVKRCQKYLAKFWQSLFANWRLLPQTVFARSCLRTR